MTDDYTPTNEGVRLQYLALAKRRPLAQTYSSALRVRQAEFDRWLAKVKADTLREAASALNKPAEGATYDMWSSDAGSWLRARADRIEGKTR